MKVLLFSNDLMPFGELPTSGGGLRCWHLMKGLQAHGVEVVVSMPGFTYLAEQYYDKIPEEQRELLWRWETQDDILARTAPDAVMFASNWDHYNLTKPYDVPLVIDLHGSRLIETRMWNTPVSTDRKLEIFSKADCLLTAGRRQRSYFYGWLVQAGRVPKDEHFIRYIPVSLSPELPQRKNLEQNDETFPHFVSGGGWFPWQNQAEAIFAICREVSARNKGRIDIFGTPHDVARSMEEKVIRQIYQQVAELANDSERINVNGYIGRDALLKIYLGASVAVEAMHYNLERELAFTTRTIEYLWCGLPVLYNNYGEVSEHIAEYDAGWAIDTQSEAETNAAIEEAFSDAEVVKRKSENAQRLVQDRFSWDKTILPLLDYLKNPTRAGTVQPSYGTVCVKASFLSPTGTAVDIPVHSGSLGVEQSFFLPAENIDTVEVPVALRDSDSRATVKFLELSLKNASGRSLSKKKIPAVDIPANGKVSISFPMIRKPSGGERIIFSMRVEGIGADIPNSDAAVTARGLLESGFPFDTDHGSGYFGQTLLGQEVKAKSLALGFIPGQPRMYAVRMLAERVWWMIRQGEWRRLVRAGVRRIPRVAQKVRRLALR